MNHPKATRLRLCLAIAVVAAFAAIAPAMASAAVTVTADADYGTGVGPGTHTDYTIKQFFAYGNGVEPQPGTTDLKKWIVDSPAGLVGNPNAVPVDKRCEPTAFDPSGVMSPYVNSSCPASSQVGDATVYLVSDAASGSIPAGSPVGTLTGEIYLLKTSPEIPTTLATRFTSTIYQAAVCSSLPGAPAAPCTIYPKTKSVLAPVTNLSAANNGDSDFRIRTVPAEYNTAPVTYGPVPPFAAGATPLHYSRIDQHLYGMADPNDNFPTQGQGDTPFLTMPHTCSIWKSYAYAISNEAQAPDTGNLAMDPNNPGDNKYVKSAADEFTPDCTNKPGLNVSAPATLSDHNRDAHPQLSVSVKNADVVNGDNPRKVVVTLPGSTTVDVQNIGNACTTAQRDAGSCPDAAQVGSATIATPLIAGGLTGKVYIVKNENKPSLPDLSIFVDGAIKFRLDATTRFVDTDSSQVEATFDNLPDLAFSDFTVTITGGSTSSLLVNRSCPTNGSAPFDGPTTAAIDGFAGPSVTTSSANSYQPCYGTPKVTKKNSCTKVGKKFSAKPSGFIDTPSIAKVQLQTSTKSKSGFKTRQTDKKTPFTFKFTLKSSKFKKNKKYYYLTRVVYKDGHVVKSKSTTFKTCK